MSIVQQIQIERQFEFVIQIGRHLHGLFDQALLFQKLGNFQMLIFGNSGQYGLGYFIIFTHHCGFVFDHTQLQTVAHNLILISLGKHRQEHKYHNLHIDIYTF